MNWGATKQAGRGFGFGMRQVGGFLAAKQGPLEALGGGIMAGASALAMPLAATVDALGAAGAKSFNAASSTDFWKNTGKAIPDKAMDLGGWGARKGYRGHMALTEPIMKGVSKAQRSLLKGWEPHKGARRTLGASVGVGAVFGVAMSSFRLNREITPEAMARAEEGSAYEGGTGAFGSGSGGRMPQASGRMTLGMHRARHG